MRKSVVKEYELDRRFDFEDFNTPAGKKITKRRARRRYRAMQNNIIKKLMKEGIKE